MSAYSKMGSVNADVLVRSHVDYFLKIDGIPGESQDRTHKSEIDLSSWYWGETQATTVNQGGGLGAGKVSLKDFRFVMTVNKASPKLALACAQGDHIKTAVLTCRKAGMQQQEYLKYSFWDLMVTSYETTGDPQTPLPTDQITLAFTKYQVDYKEQKADGTLGGAVQAWYDQKQQISA